jgi:hypothetical protein
MSNIVLPEEYKTGNKKMDEMILKAYMKDPGKRRLLDLELEPEKKGRIQVSAKEDRTYRDGTLFASRGEMLRYDYLLNIQKTGAIRHLRTQVEFVLQESFISKQKEWGNVGALVYVADFTYLNVSFRKGYEGRECVEDHKGCYLTDVYKIKRKLFLYKHAWYAFFEVGNEG